jgi:hypothetical protein
MGSGSAEFKAGLADDRNGWLERLIEAVRRE